MVVCHTACHVTSCVRYGGITRDDIIHHTVPHRTPSDKTRQDNIIHTTLHHSTWHKTKRDYTTQHTTTPHRTARRHVTVAAHHHTAPRHEPGQDKDKTRQHHTTTPYLWRCLVSSYATQHTSSVVHHCTCGVVSSHATQRPDPM